MSDTGRWERLSSEKLLETPYFALRSDKLRLPDGAVKDPYSVIQRPYSAIVFPLMDTDAVILARQYPPATDRIALGPPAGLVEEGAEPEQAGWRELLEDTG